MAFVIVEGCTKDEKCIEVCPVDCIHPRKDEPQFADVTQLYIDPVNCIDCGACVPVCPTFLDLRRGRGAGEFCRLYRQERRALSIAAHGPTTF